MKSRVILFLSLLSAFFSFSVQGTIKDCSDRENFIINKTVGYFSQRSEPKLIEKNFIHKKRNYSKYHYVISSINAGQEIQSEFYFYESQVGFYAKKPTILLFSGIQGVSLLERYVANKLASRGFSIVISSQRNIEKMDRIEKVKPFLANSVFTSLNITDFVSNIKTVDEKNISTIGISLGGFRALYLSLIDMRVKSNVLVVSGLSIADAIAYSSLYLAEDLRAHQMKALGLDPSSDQAKYLELLKKELPFHAKDLVCRRKTKDFFLFQSQRDTTVPYFQQKALQKALGRPQLVKTRLLGHKGSVVLYALTGLSDSVEFIKNHHITSAFHPLLAAGYEGYGKNTEDYSPFIIH